MFGSLNPIATELFEVFFTIARQVKDIAVKGGFLRTTRHSKHLYILDED